MLPSIPFPRLPQLDPLRWQNCDIRCRNTTVGVAEKPDVNQQQWRQMTPGQQAEHISRYGPPPAGWTTIAQPRYDTGYNTATARRGADVLPAPTPQVVVVERKRRRIWPWVLLALVLIPVLLFAACTALVGGAVKSVDDARKGGTVNIGQTFSYASGLALTVSAPEPFTESNPYIVSRDEAAYEVTVTIKNGTKDPVGAALITTNVTVNSTPAEQIFDGNSLPTQDIAVGQQLQEPIRFKVKKTTRGPLQVAVTDTFNEPVFFTGTLG